MSDTNERSGASAGSVAGEPVAWAVLDSRGTVCVAYLCREAAEAYCEGTFNRLAPLYRQPPATDLRRDRDRRERIATAVLAGIAAQLDANGCALQSVSDADVKYSVQVADMLIEELDKEGER